MVRGINKEEINKIIELNKKGLNDVEISKKVKCDRVTIRQYRIKLGLKLNAKAPQKKIDKEQIKEFINKGYSDKEIANILKSNEHTIGFIRRREFKIIKKYGFKQIDSILNRKIYFQGGIRIYISGEEYKNIYEGYIEIPYGKSREFGENILNLLKKFVEVTTIGRQEKPKLGNPFESIDFVVRDLNLKNIFEILNKLIEENNYRIVRGFRGSVILCKAY